MICTPIFILFFFLPILAACHFGLNGLCGIQCSAVVTYTARGVHWYNTKLGLATPPANRSHSISRRSSFFQHLSTVPTSRSEFPALHHTIRLCVAKSRRHPRLFAAVPENGKRRWSHRRSVQSERLRKRFARLDRSLYISNASE